MEILQKQNELLRGYVGTLQKQNQAKNFERTALVNEIDRLGRELDNISRQLQFNSSTVAVNSKQSVVQKQLKSQKESNAALIKQIEYLKNKILEYNNQLVNKQEEVQRLSEQIQSNLIEIQCLKDNQLHFSTENNQIAMLQTEIAAYKLKITENINLQQHLRAAANKIAELQSLNQRLQSDFNRIEADNRRMETQYKKIESEGRDMRSSGKSVTSATQISTLLSAKLNLEATIRQLSGKIQWLEGNSKAIEQQRLQLQRRSRELQKQLLEAKGKIMQLRMNQQSYNNAEVNIMIKEKEMEALEQMIISLKQNKKYLQKALRDKEESMLTLQSQLYSFKALKCDNDQTQRQVNDLKNQKIQLQKQLTAALNTNQGLELERSKFYQKQKSLLEQMSVAKQQRDRLVKEREVQTAILEQTQKQLKILKTKMNEDNIIQQTPFYRVNIPERDNNFDKEDLRMEVEKLRSELDQLKYLPQFKSQYYSEMQPMNNEQKDYGNTKNFTHKREKSPDRRVHSKVQLNNEKGKPVGNREKWQTLQKKINALRSENQTLKKTLFD